MIHELTQEIHQALLAEGEFQERRRVVSQRLVIEEDAEESLQREIVIDTVTNAAQFACLKQLSFQYARALLALLDKLFQSFILPEDQFSVALGQLLEQTRTMIESEGQQIDGEQDPGAWKQVVEYLATNILPQRDAFRYMLQNMPLEIEKTVTVCVDTPLAYHPPLSE